LCSRFLSRRRTLIDQSFTRELAAQSNIAHQGAGFDVPDAGGAGLRSRHSGRLNDDDALAQQPAGTPPSVAEAVTTEGGRKRSSRCGMMSLMFDSVFARTDDAV
jgi:hypothetical protein